MTRGYAGRKGRSDTPGHYYALPSCVYNSANYAKLTAHGVRLLVDIGIQYKGSNNGDLSATYKQLQKRGWKSPSTLNKAIKEVLYYGFVEITRRGGINQCSLYALAWHPIDECNGKLDVPATRQASHAYRNEKPLFAQPKIRQNKAKNGGVKRESSNAKLRIVSNEN